MGEESFRFGKTAGVVLLGGRLAVESANDWVTIFTLPSDHRPSSTIACGLTSERGPVEVWIQPDGSMVADSPGRGWIDFDGVTFPAA